MSLFAYPDNLAMPRGLQYFILALFILSSPVAEQCQAKPRLVIHAKTGCAFELQGYEGLDTILLDQGELSEGESLHIETPYQGLAMLVFSGGQKYPLIISGQAPEVTITGPDELPSFAEGDENFLFYQLLSGKKPADKGNGFAGLLIKGKELLDSSSSIQTVEELQDKKAEFQEFVRRNYLEISRSDLLIRFIWQYFMMHEYVQYHREGTPAGDIRSRYQQEVLAGVSSLLTLLQDDIPENELLNYILGLYYNRGMVTLASFIADNFKEIAFCGDEKPALRDFPEDLPLIHPDGSAAGTVGSLQGAKQISIVSSDCPVSMVETVIQAREATDPENHAANQFIIVVPLEKLSAKHRAMSRSVSGNNTMLFVDDEVWCKKHLPKNIRLPFSVNK